MIDLTTQSTVLTPLREDERGVIGKIFFVGYLHLPYTVGDPFLSPPSSRQGHSVDRGRVLMFSYSLLQNKLKAVSTIYIYTCLLMCVCLCIPMESFFKGPIPGQRICLIIHTSVNHRAITLVNESEINGDGCIL